MRKRIISQDIAEVVPTEDDWLDLESLAEAEVSSEDAEYPIESALISNKGLGWRAAQAGQQTLRVLFNRPQKIRRIHLVFKEEEQERTQEFVLRWSSAEGQPCQEIARQQYNFSPQGTTVETEDFLVDLDGLTALELVIIPDVSGGDSYASIAKWRLA